MTTLMLDTTTPSGTARRSTLTGTGRLVWFMLRRDRVRLTVWIVSLLALYGYFVVALTALYPTFEERQSRAALMTEPASVFMGGPAYGIDDYTIGAMFSNEMSLWMIVGLGLMNIFEVVRNTRAEEESGRAELVRARAVGRHAPAVAALLTVVITNVVFAVLGSALLIGAGDLPVTDTFAMSASIGVSSLVFAAVAVVTAQLTNHARGATGLAVAVLGAAVLVRGVGDLRGDVAVDHGSLLSWFSPIAWTQQMRAYVDLRWWPMALSILTVITLLVLGAVLASRRDFDGSLLADRPGRSAAGASLSGPLGMAWRQHRSAMFWWFVGTFAMFFATGTYLGGGIETTLEAMAADNPAMLDIFGDDPVAGFLSIMILYAALAAAGYAIAMVLRAKAEESEGRLEITLAKPVTRTRWLAAHTAVVAVGASLLTMVSGALALWAGARTNGPIALDTFVTGGAAFLPAVAVLLALTAALYAWLPRLTPVMWALLAYVFVIGMFGPALDLPDAANALSPFWWVGRYPQEPIDATRMIGLCALAASLLAAAFVGFRRRDIPAL